MNTVKRYEFEGRAFEARVLQGEEWFTAAQVAEMLGHESANSVLSLYRAHRDEFEAHETCEAILAELSESNSLNSEKRARRGNPRIKVRLFSMDGVEHLAILAKKAGVKLRRWCIALRGRFRRGESAEITREQYEALKSEVARLLLERNDRDKLLGVFASAAATSITAAAKVMGSVGGAMRKHPEVRARIEDAKREAKRLAAASKVVPLFDGKGA